MNREKIIKIAKDAGIDAMVGTFRSGKYEPKLNALKTSVPVEWLEKFAYMLLTESPSDKDMIDWLSNQYVIVRTLLLYGSRDCFTGSPDDSDPCSFPLPWDIREAIAKAMKE